MTQILHQLIGNLVTPIIYQMFFLFKESQVVISRWIRTFCQKKHLPLSGSRVNRAAGAEGVLCPVGLLLKLLLCRGAEKEHDVI